ncbi:MAG: hypothetical protein HYT30_01180 [Parcubacteria group bacterium]|nr:hypothetical protein [Parcubacteria group bacterium]
MRKARKSANVEVIAFSIFIVALVGYNILGTFSILPQSMGAAAGSSNIDCGASWKGFYQKAQADYPPPQGNDAKWKQEADTKNQTQPCSEPGGSGKCGFGMAPNITPNATVCSADKDDAGNKATDEGAKQAMDAAKKAAEDLAKKAGEKKGGEGGGMPQMPQPKEKPPKQPEDNKGCPEGQEKTATGCQEKNPAANFGSGTLSNFLESFKKTFGLTGGSGSGGETPEEALARIAGEIDKDPTVPAQSKPAIQGYVKAFIDEHGAAPTSAQIKQVVGMPVNEIPQTRDALREAAQGLNTLAPSSGLFGSGNSSPEETNVLNRVFNWLKNLI